MSNHDHPVNRDRVDAVRAEGLPAYEAASLSRLLALLADPLRARIVAALLVAEEVCVGDLALALDASEDAVSYGVRRLRNAGLVRRRREGRMGYYRLPDGATRRALAAAMDQLRRLGALDAGDGDSI